MKATESWITYRTRFLVKAKQLTTSLAFTDVLGRQHRGRKGDYLVESSDGVLCIQPRQIFEDIYVPLATDQSPDIGLAPSHVPASNAPSATRTSPASDLTSRSRQTEAFPLLPMARKSPQPYRDRRTPTAGYHSR